MCWVAHALFSPYWATGETFLIESLGSRLVETFRAQEWILIPVGVVKVTAAWAPMWLAQRGWPARRRSRGACWVDTAALIVWGGANTVVENLVLGGVVNTEGGYDRMGMIGHAYLWDPLFWRGVRPWRGV